MNDIPDDLINIDMIDESMLTTKDNPFNPFTQWDDWYAYDIEKGYCTCAYLARVCKSSDELSDKEESLAISLAMNQIVKLNLLGNYIKVTEENFSRLVP